MNNWIQSLRAKNSSADKWRAYGFLYLGLAFVLAAVAHFDLAWLSFLSGAFAGGGLIGLIAASHLANRERLQKQQ